MFEENVKLIMNWDIKPEKDQEYFEFVVREWVPTVTRLGIETSGAWLTVYSREYVPKIMAEAIADDLATMRRILDSPEWQTLHAKLQTFVDNYSHKIVRVNGEFQF